MKKEFIEIFQNLTVLIAEDNTKQREKLKEIISLFTDDYITAVDGAEAYKLYKKHNPHLIISDIKMPKMNGLELTRRIREIDKKTPIIILTAYSEKNLLLKAVSLHLNNYIVKPINENKLIESLVKVLDIIKAQSILQIKLKDDCVLDILEKCIYKDDKKIKLTKKEMLFLNLLLKYPNQVVSRDKIEKTIWGGGIMTGSALKNFIFKIRKKIGHNSLNTSSSNGYSLQVV